MYEESLLKTPLCVLFDFEPSALGMNNNQTVPSFYTVPCHHFGSEVALRENRIFGVEFIFAFPLKFHNGKAEANTFMYVSNGNTALFFSTEIFRAHLE